MKDRLKTLRKTLGLKQREIAERLGVSTGAIGLWESGVDPPGSARIYQICKEFNVSESWLRTGAGEMFNKPAVESDADITRRHIVELFEKMPAPLQEEFMKICQDIVEKIQKEKSTGEIKRVTIGDNNRNIHIEQ